MAAGHVWLSHVGLTALHYRDEAEPGLPRGMYVGFGVARYRYFVQRGHVATRRHGVSMEWAGFEYFGIGSRWGFHTDTPRPRWARRQSGLGSDAADDVGSAGLSRRF